MPKSVVPNRLYVELNSTELEVVLATTSITLNSTNAIGADLSTAITGSTSAAAPASSDLNATNSRVNQLIAALVDMGLLTT